ncbi:hypothetical protein BDZ89DRAFT_944749 [Hymenopellis radicata]|nr:hypothetical protein BDZ89DRAFT_944749 [Hymenopellis radicata]
MPSLFPSVGAQVVSSLIHFLGVSLLSHCLSRRIALERLVSYRAIFQIPWPRLCLILVFLDSWLFLFSSGILIFGVGLELQESVCSAAIHLCIAFYSTSKLLIYAFLIERVYIVWSPVSCVARFKSPIYVVSFITVCLYSVVIFLMLFGECVRTEGDMACMIGLKAMSSIPLLSYDLYISIFLTAAFLWPLIRTQSLNRRVKRVAKRALVASTVALTTSTVNIAVLTALRGHELGWLCLGSCGADVRVALYLPDVLAVMVTTGHCQRLCVVLGHGRQETERNTDLSIWHRIKGSQFNPCIPSRRLNSTSAASQRVSGITILSSIFETSIWAEISSDRGPYQCWRCGRRGCTTATTNSFKAIIRLV